MNVGRPVAAASTVATGAVPPGLYRTRMIALDVSDHRLLETVTKRRAEQAARECGARYDGLTVGYEITGDRGIITVLQDGRYVISKEMVETEESLAAPHKLVEYAKVLMNKARLVVVVPKSCAVDHRLRMLELNNYWLCYYQLLYYDERGGLYPLDRRSWRRLRGLPPDEARSPEVV